MAETPLIPVSEYLGSSYRPDRDYLEGQLKERNLGERPHSEVQGMLAFIFHNNRARWGVGVLMSQRIQIAPQRFRVSDVVVVRDSDPRDDIIRVPPLICAEVVSREDTLSELQERVNDYVAMGVENIWAFDPWKQIAYSCSTRGFQQPEDGFLRVAGTPIEVELKEVFAELDRA